MTRSGQRKIDPPAVVRMVLTLQQPALREPTHHSADRVLIHRRQPTQAVLLCRTNLGQFHQDCELQRSKAMGAESLREQCRMTLVGSP